MEVNANTGKPNKAIIRPQDLISHYSDISTYEERIYSPDVYLEPRLVKVGISLLY